MATITLCDGGCGAQSPDPTSRPGPHVANNWLRVRAATNRLFDDASKHHDKLFCKNCAPRVIAAMENQSA